MSVMELPTVTVDGLRIFHAKHFPHAPTPADFVSGAEPVVEEYDHEEEDDGLGYYEDGVKRTLTDEQIALFRHTEIQTIIRERLRKRESGSSTESETALRAPKFSPPAESAQEQDITNRNKVQDGRVEKQNNWTKVSMRTKEKNRKNRKRLRASQKEKRRKQREEPEEEEESDEWDPWHQANGPDVQKDTSIDLDY